MHRQQAALERRAASGGKKDEALSEGIVDGDRSLVRLPEMEAGVLPVAQIPAGQCQRQSSGSSRCASR
ncbi:MAG: hypothetical protein OXH70_16450 [Acidobacteria bacterium]|nr:hypothetical protein [Acidobacteriota bacterium]